MSPAKATTQLIERMQWHPRGPVSVLRQNGRRGAPEPEPAADLDLDVDLDVDVEAGGSPPLPAPLPRCPRSSTRPLTGKLLPAWGAGNPGE